MAIKNVTKTLFNINADFVAGSVKDATGSGVIGGVLYVPVAYLSASRGSLTIRGSRGTSKTVTTLSGASFGTLTLTQDSSPNSQYVAFAVTSSDPGIQVEGIFQIDAVFSEDDGIAGAKVSSSDITDATTTGKAVLTAADVAALKTLLTLVSGDITDAGTVGKDVLKSATGSAALTALRIVPAFSAVMLTTAPSAAQKSAFLSLIGAQPAA